MIVITPVPSDPPSPSVVPGYLIGLSPSATVAADVGGVIAPLGGNADSLNAPGGTGSSQRAETVRTSTPPLPLLFLGLVLASSLGGVILYRYGPRGKPLPRSRRPGALVIPSEYGGENRVTTLLDPEVRPAQGERRRRRGASGT